MTPDESALLDRLADRHGTIRGAVLSGLRNLDADRTADLEEHVRKLMSQLAATQQSGKADRDRAATDLSSVKAELADAERTLAAVQATVKGLRGDLRDTRAKLSREREARRAAEDGEDAAQDLRVHQAYCAACDKLVPESEWAEQPWRSGFATFHKRHGFHEKSGFLGQPASLLFWRPRSSTQ